MKVMPNISISAAYSIHSSITKIHLRKSLNMLIEMCVSYGHYFPPHPLIDEKNNWESYRRLLMNIKVFNSRANL